MPSLTPDFVIDSLRAHSAGSNPWETPSGRRLRAQQVNTSPDILLALAKDNDPEVRESVARNPMAPIEALALLALDDQVQIRISVAKHVAAPPSALERLAADTHKDLRWFVASHRRTPLEVLRRLAKDTVVTVRGAAQKHPAMLHCAE